FFVCPVTIFVKSFKFFNGHRYQLPLTLLHPLFAARRRNKRVHPVPRQKRPSKNAPRTDRCGSQPLPSLAHSTSVPRRPRRYYPPQRNIPLGRGRPHSRLTLSEYHLC